MERIENKNPRDLYADVSPCVCVRARARVCVRLFIERFTGNSALNLMYSRRKQSIFNYFTSTINLRMDLTNERKEKKNNKEKTN